MQSLVQMAPDDDLAHVAEAGPMIRHSVNAQIDLGQTGMDLPMCCVLGMAVCVIQVRAENKGGQKSCITRLIRAMPSYVIFVGAVISVIAAIAAFLFIYFLIGYVMDTYPIVSLIFAFIVGVPSALVLVGMLCLHTYNFYEYLRSCVHDADTD